MREAPFYLDDVDALRDKLARAERDGTRLGQVWSALRRRAQAAPENFPWFLPFTALVTGRPEDLEAARRVLRRYVGTFPGQELSMGLHFHFWCAAFPHARWCLYFQWLRALNAWDADEERALREALIAFQFVHFFFGLRTKPEPECVDNQTLSLCYANALVGHLFGRGPQGSAVAARLLEDGRRRLPDMLGGMPPSGYSGEGSTYMDHVVGPGIPLVVEFLERAEGGDWYGRALPPDGGSAAATLRMIAREWTTAGLTLPWDHYGYALPMRSAIAYAARRTGEPFYRQLLERYANWSHDTQVGWGYDDLVWSLVWWPDTPAAPARKVFASWSEPTVGGAVVSADEELYLMQMWDPSSPVHPVRAHVNPNALVLVAHGSPLTVDGVGTKECTTFRFDDTWREVTGQDFTPRRYNFGEGCGGAHGVLLMDGWEGMRAQGDYPQAGDARFDEDAGTLGADVTPIYRERFPDVRRVRRTSRLCDGRFWIVTDDFEADAEHEITARWLLRPRRVEAERGVCIETAEGVRLHLLPLAGPDAAAVRPVAGFPDRLDGECLMVDFRQRGRVCRWVWLAWPARTRREAADVSDGWQALPDPEARLEEADARRALPGATLVVPFTLPPFMLTEAPVVRRWWFRRTVAAPAGPWWLRLPRGLREARLWVAGREIDLAPRLLLGHLMPLHVPMPEGAGHVEVLVRTDCGIHQYVRGDAGGSGFSGQSAVLVPAPAEPVTHAALAGTTAVVRSGRREWRVELGDT